MPIDPNHIPQKKRKIITHFSNGEPIPKEMQRMVGKGLKLVEEDKVHNALIDAAIKFDEKDGGPMFSDNGYELYWINNCIFIYRQETNEIWLTKDSDITDLMPDYWDELLKQLNE